MNDEWPWKKEKKLVYSNPNLKGLDSWSLDLDMLRIPNSDFNCNNDRILIAIMIANKHEL